MAESHSPEQRLGPLPHTAVLKVISWLEIPFECASLLESGLETSLFADVCSLLLAYSLIIPIQSMNEILFSEN